jgi:hypothetical protein
MKERKKGKKEKKPHFFRSLLGLSSSPPPPPPPPPQRVSQRSRRLVVRSQSFFCQFPIMFQTLPQKPFLSSCSCSSSFSTTTMLLLFFFFLFFFFCYPPNLAGTTVPSKLSCFSCHKSQEEEETKIAFVFSKTTTPAS